MFQLLIFLIMASTGILDSNGRFFFSDNRTQFDTAAQNCETMGMELAILKTQADYHELEVLYGTKTFSIWIGLQYNSTEKNYQWIDGTFMDVVQWGLGEPSSGTNRCAFINQTMKWYTHLCSDEKHYVCVDFSPVPVYTFGSVKVSHAEAQQRCLQNKSILPIIITKAEETALMAFLDTLDLRIEEEFWIGLYQNNTDGEYEWMNDVKLADFYEWDHFTPVGPYVHIHKEFKLHPAPNTYRIYVCQNKSAKGIDERKTDYYYLESANAWPWGVPRKEVSITRKTECAAHCSRDPGCFKYSVYRSNCKTFGNVFKSTFSEEIRLYKRRLISD